LLFLLAEGDLAAFSHDHKTNHFKSGQPTAAAAAPPAATSTQVVSVGNLSSFWDFLLVIEPPSLPLSSFQEIKMLQAHFPIRIKRVEQHHLFSQE
jgi:hypothetical protein